MSWFLLVRKVVCCCALAAWVPVAFAQLSYVPQAGQYMVTSPLIGEQVFPQLALGTNASYLVWEDNRTDGNGNGISVLPLDGNFSGIMAPIQVNETSVGNQTSPQVARLANGGAAFVWLSGRPELRQPYVRFMTAAGLFTGKEVAASANTNRTKFAPVVAGLTNGNAVVVWGSYNQYSSNSLQDVYGQIFTPTGSKVGAEFRLNSFTKYNQRTPAVAAMPNGNFIAVWVSEQQRYEVRDTADGNTQISPGAPPSVDIYGRIFSATGSPITSEFVVNTVTNLCANPSVAVAANGTFMVAWSQREVQDRTNSWDVFARSFSTLGSPAGEPKRVNTFVRGDQFAPRIAAAGSDYMIVWTSLGQDGSREGVFGQFLRGNGLPVGNEVLVNTETASQQMQPAVGSDGSRFLVVWSSFTSLATAFDIFGQRFVNTDLPLAPMNPPFVEVPFNVANGSYKPELRVSWPVQAGLHVTHYEVYVNNSSTPAATLATNYVVLNNVSANTTYSIKVAFVTADQRKSPLSEATQVTTWGGLNWGGIPFEWMTSHYGSDISSWPPAGTRLGNDGPTLISAFLSGADPQNPHTWLRTKLLRKPNGAVLAWNPQPGLVYQPQVSSDLRTWVNLGGPRFAADYTDSLNVGGSALSYYRVLRLR